MEDSGYLYFHVYCVFASGLEHLGLGHWLEFSHCFYSSLFLQGNCLQRSRSDSIVQVEVSFPAARMVLSPSPSYPTPRTEYRSCKQPSLIYSSAALIAFLLGLPDASETLFDLQICFTFLSFYQTLIKRTSLL